MLPLGCEAAPKSAFRSTASTLFTTAAQPSGSKLPRHRFVVRLVARGEIPRVIFACTATVIYENQAVSQRPATLSLPAPNSTCQARRFSRCPTVWVLPALSFCPH
ncbi:hypothetical protein C3E98_011050 [Pseudomonas sp. MWU13-2625]|nr:hypothetical protein C3E98_011050 [Pseudomonas sp. MWU13-2625]